MKKHILTLLAVAIGGGLGTLLRYVINIQTITLLFPLGTVIENLIGSFLLGTLTGWLVNQKINEVVKVGFGVGFCGGFTTMSTLAADFYFLVINEQWLFVYLYLFISLFFGVTLAFLGYFVAERASLKYTVRRTAGEKG